MYEVFDTSTEPELNTVVTIIHAPNGSEEMITGNDVIDLIQRSLDEENPDSKAADKLVLLIGTLLDGVADQPEFSEDPVLIRMMEGMRLIYSYLQGVESGEKLDKFLKGDIEFMAIPRPAGLEEFLNINTGGIKDDVHIKDLGDLKVTFKGRLGIDEQKIHEMLRLAFSSNNIYGNKTRLNTLVEIPFTYTMKILKRTPTERNRKAFSSQLKQEILPAIAQAYIEINTKEGWLTISVGGGIKAVNVRRDKIYFQLSDAYAAYLNTKHMSQYNSKTLMLGNQRNPLPFYLAIKLQDQYFHDGNKRRRDRNKELRPVNDVLQVKTILKFCSNDMNKCLPSYEEVQAKDNGHWVRRIRAPLEAALNEIQDAGLFTWNYCKSGKAEATLQEICTNDYKKWSNLYITFKLIPEEPDQTKRLEHKQARIEAALAKKVIKDAETLVKADKIRKRKRKNDSK